MEAFICIKRNVFLDTGGFNKFVNWGEGGELLSRISKGNSGLTILNTPKYTYSFRRHYSKGLARLSINVIIKELFRYSRLEMLKSLSDKLYPIQGGQNYK